MYIGMPNKWFVEEEKARHEMSDKLDLKVLHLSDATTFSNLLDRIAAQPVKWTEQQFKTVEYLFNVNSVLTHYYNAGKSLKCKFTNSCYVIVPNNTGRYYRYDLICETSGLNIPGSDFNPALFQEF
jgi:hypothetical protein